jgi:hypothetical protein
MNTFSSDRPPIPYSQQEIVLNPFNRMLARSALAIAFATLTSSLATAGTVIVNPTVTGSAGSFLYSYTITNNTPDDPFVIDIPVPNRPSAVTNLIAPSGFKAAFDSGLGLVSFLEDSLFFTSAPVSGFSFTSPYGPGSVLFQATTLSSSSGNVYTISGPTMAPVPEPGYVAILAVLALAAAPRIRRAAIHS